ncbi:LysR family transcriptional regulator [Tepidibacter thalassicus]|uniref:DNA-binding transcriptional regulator, LysR family n=1 Tax=Tepidibacter thalassicus DSM 15285 TaxID=1123350 RepID=A0A1M5QFR0_9FIRM|nr:LysR family transcriptional regulator [Tepidibacter thalassicus]SHH13054.1 DNA-binding transcriptional regulator, LysR family [Tepidibacter thalassicus DSM 15285]
MIDTRLITFLTVAKTKNYTKAGQILNLTQPAVSQQIKFLEEYYNVKLIKKRGKQIDLTQEGEILFKYAKELEILSRNLESKLKNKSSIVKKYNIGATMTIGEYVLPYILGEYRNIYKNIDIILNVNNTKIIIEKLLNREIDLALIEGCFDKSKFNYKKMKDDELVLAVSNKHYFSKKKEVELDEVLSGNLILREKGSGTREIFENKLVELGYNLEKINVYMEIGSINAIKSLVESNLGYTVISKEAIKREVNLGVINIVPIKDVKIIREFNFVYLNDGFMDFIDDFINFCYTRT